MFASFHGRVCDVGRFAFLGNRFFRRLCDWQERDNEYLRRRTYRRRSSRNLAAGYSVQSRELASGDVRDRDDVLRRHLSVE